MQSVGWMILLCLIAARPARAACEGYKVAGYVCEHLLLNVFYFTAILYYRDVGALSPRRKNRHWQQC